MLQSLSLSTLKKMHFFEFFFLQIVNSYGQSLGADIGTFNYNALVLKPHISNNQTVQYVDVYVSHHHHVPGNNSIPTFIYSADYFYTVSTKAHVPFKSSFSLDSNDLIVFKDNVDTCAGFAYLDATIGFLLGNFAFLTNYSNSVSATCNVIASLNNAEDGISQFDVDAVQGELNNSIIENSVLSNSISNLESENATQLSNLSSLNF